MGIASAFKPSFLDTMRNDPYGPQADTSKSDREIMVAAINKIEPGFNCDGRDDVALRSVFDLCVARASRNDSLLGAVSTTAANAATVTNQIVRGSARTL